MFSIKSKHQFLVKASWRATAILLKIDAKDEEEAMVKAAKKVLKMEGGVHCTNIELIRQFNDTE